MKLHKLCMQDILRYLIINIVVQDNGNTSYIDVGIIVKDNPNYEKKDVLYSIKKLDELKYIIVDKSSNGISRVYDVTILGHYYIEEL